MRSLHRKLVCGTAVAMAVVLFTLAGVLYMSVRASLMAEFDHGLLSQAEALASAAEVHQGAVKVEESEEPPEFRGGSNPQYFELWQRGRVTSRSLSLGARDLPALSVGTNDFIFQNIQLPDGRAGRQVAIVFLPQNEETEQGPAPTIKATLVVASDTGLLQLAMSRLRWLLAGACGSAVIVSIGALTLIIRRALAPVGEIAAQIDGVGRHDLSDRLDAGNVPGELLPVVNRLNEMLSRLQKSFERERGFSADVAHELRTPLAGLETALEVASSRPRSTDEYQRVLARCLQTTRQMHAMVESLLMLARGESGSLAIRASDFSLCELVDECWQVFDDRALESRLRVTRSCGLTNSIRTDREKLRLVLHNLLDNAVSYADEGGSIRLDVLQNNRQVRVIVANSGSRLSPDSASQAFERFWRGDTARAETGSHTGLGLPITRQLLELMGGTVTVDSTVGGDFVACVEFPMNLGDS
jgi:signal transduction histidine kinase